MVSLKQELYDIFQALVNDRDQLRLEVTQAQEIIGLLEMEINAIKSHGDEAFEKVTDKMEITKHTFELVAEPTSASHWLRDIWLSEPNNAALHGAAEAADSHRDRLVDTQSTDLRMEKRASEIGRRGCRLPGCAAGRP